MTKRFPLIRLVILGISVAIGTRIVFNQASGNAQNIAHSITNHQTAQANRGKPQPRQANCASLETQGIRLPVPTTPRAITGRIGLYIAKLAPGTVFRPLKIIALRENEVFPLASSFKTAVVHELMHQIDAGRVKANEQFSVTWSNQSLGNYPYDGTTALGLADRAIRHSDNTATDILFRRIGLESLQRRIDALGLCKTRLLLPTKTWWTAEAGLGGPEFPANDLVKATYRFATASPAKRRDIAKRLDERALQIGPETLRLALEPYWNAKRASVEAMYEIDRNLQNASTPFEWAHYLFEAINDTTLLPQTKAQFREIMSHGYGYRRLEIERTYFAGKAGNTGHVLTLTGYIETAAGRYVYSFFNDENKLIYTFSQAPTAMHFISTLLKLLR